MSIINGVFRWIVSQISKLLPKLGVSQELMNNIDSAFATIISLLNSVGYIFPLSTLVLCLFVVWGFDISMIVFRVVQWVIKLVRG